MFKIHQNLSLKPFHTFALDVNTRFWFEFSEPDELFDFIASDERATLPRLVLGGGSNILFTKNFDGVVYHPLIKQKRILIEDDEQVLIDVGAGENWDEFVEFTVNQGWYGLENLSLIPGNIGASPIQNIGAYGIEVKSVIESVKVLFWENKEIKILSNQDCQFDYRKSIFKTELKGKCLILSVVFRLSKKETYNIDYVDLKKELGNTEKINSEKVRKAIISIRKRKLPDYLEYPNAGSFFKNPLVTKRLAESLIKEYPEIVVYGVSENECKLAAGWLIDKCGWKGKRIGNTGVHHNQALVLINFGNANGFDILQLAEKIKESVFLKFGVVLETEVNII
jgi:UDP-N-acetylmuramate dehydrogenase